MFVASVPPPEVIESLTAAVAPLHARAPTLRWTPPSRWHVTLAFLGPVDEKIRPELDRRLGRVATRHTPVELGVSGGGRFGQRILFAKIAGDLGPLAAGVRRAAQRSGIGVRRREKHGSAALGPASGVPGLDDRPFHAHLTLARVPERERADLRDLVATLRTATAGCPLWTADEIVLFASTGGPHVTYHPLATWPLT